MDVKSRGSLWRDVLDFRPGNRRTHRSDVDLWTAKYL